MLLLFQHTYASKALGKKKSIDIEFDELLLFIYKRGRKTNGKFNLENFTNYTNMLSVHEMKTTSFNFFIGLNCSSKFN